MSLKRRGGENIALILNFGTRRKFVVNITPQPPYLQERSPVPFVYSGGGHQRWSGRFWRRQNTFPLLWFELRAV